MNRSTQTSHCTHCICVTTCQLTKQLKVITPRDFHFKRTKLEQKLEEYKGTKHLRESTILHIL